MKTYIRQIPGLLCLSLIVAIIAKADIPPDPGYKRVYTDLVVTAQDDFPEYRFFFRTMRDVEEISLNKSEARTITFKGGGAAGSGGTLFAIPKASLKQYGEKLSPTDLDALRSAIGEKKIAGVVELLNHSFVHDVLLVKSAPSAEEYQLKRDSSGGISAVVVSPSAAAGGSGAGVTGITREISGFGIATIAGGLLLSLAIIFLGLWAVLRSFRQKSKPA